MSAKKAGGYGYNTNWHFRNRRCSFADTKPSDVVIIDPITGERTVIKTYKSKGQDKNGALKTLLADMSKDEIELFLIEHNLIKANKV